MNEKIAEHAAEVLIHTILVLVVDDQWTSCLLVAPVAEASSKGKFVWRLPEHFLRAVPE